MKVLKKISDVRTELEQYKNKKSYTFIKFSDISELLINIQLMFCLLQKKIKAWQGPIFPCSHPQSIFGAEGLNYRVRNVTGCTTFAVLTKLN